MVCFGCQCNLGGDRQTYWRNVPAGFSVSAFSSGHVGLSEHYQEKPLCGDCAYSLERWQQRRIMNLALWIGVPIFLFLCLAWGITIGIQASGTRLVP